MTAITNNMPSNGGPSHDDEPSLLRRLSLGDWAFAAVVLAAAMVTFWLYHGAMDGYEQGILLGTIPSAIALGWFWRPAGRLMLGGGAIALLAIWLYQTPTGADLARAEQVFFSNISSPASRPFCGCVCCFS